MTLSDLQDQIIPQIETGLQEKINALDFNQAGQLKRMITYQMGWRADGTHDGPGKRIRPFLTLLCAGACDGHIEAALPAAIAIELLHNFTLIHDDIQDKSPLRHGKPSLWKKWGIAQAINAGDALFAIAQMAILELAKTVNEHISNLAACELNQVCLHLTQGQYLDIAFESLHNVDIKTYLEMIEGKTAALIAFTAYVGGLAAGQAGHILDLLSAYGQCLGMAFQIQDDFLGIWGDPFVTGKSTASDLLTRKKSLPILYGLENCPEFQAQWKNTTLTTEHVDDMAKTLEICGAKQFVLSKAKDYTERAFENLEQLFPRRNTYAAGLFDLTDALLNRNL